MKQIISIISMIVIALIGNIIKATIIKRSKNRNWTLFLYLVVEIALYQIVTDVNLRILCENLTEMFKALFISIAVLVMSVNVAGINDYEDETGGIYDI